MGVDIKIITTIVVEAEVGVGGGGDVGICGGEMDLAACALESRDCAL